MSNQAPEPRVIPVEGTLECDLDDAAKVALAEDNHLWINAMACVRPSETLYRGIGKDIVDMLNASPIDGELLGARIGKVLYVRINKS